MLRAVILLLAVLFAGTAGRAQHPADAASYLGDIRTQLDTPWPRNRTVNIVFHGHSVPSGYFVTPVVRTLEAYPHRTLEGVKGLYPRAVVNVITTSIGGEHSEAGARRFRRDVLSHRPDVLFIDYALNDRQIGLARARRAWERMIRIALRHSVKVVLMTPTPDLREHIEDPSTPLARHAQQVRSLAAKYRVGLVDSYSIFRQMAFDGTDLKAYMSQSNHPNERGHRVVADAILDWFVKSDGYE